MRTSVTVRFANPEQLPVAIHMMDLSGRVISVPMTQHEEGATLDTQNLADGFYYLKVRVGTSVQGIKLLKQN